MSDATRDEVIVRLLDSITPILLDLAKLPERLDRISSQLAAIDSTLSRLHDRLDFLVVDHEAFDTVIEDFKEAVTTMRVNNSIMDEKLRMDKEVRSDKKAASRLKWDRITRIVLGIAGSGSVLYLVVEHFLKAIVK